MRCVKAWGSAGRSLAVSGLWDLRIGRVRGPKLLLSGGAGEVEEGFGLGAGDPLGEVVDEGGVDGGFVGAVGVGVGGEGGHLSVCAQKYQHTGEMVVGYHLGWGEMWGLTRD